MGCHYKDPTCGFLQWVDDPHMDRMQSWLEFLSIDANDREYDMSDDEFKFRITEERNRARDRVAPEMTRIRDECQRLEATMSALMSSVDSIAFN